MNTNKEVTLKKINKEFLKLSNLTLEQLEILSQLLQQKESVISPEILKIIEKNEKNINKLDLKLDDHIIKTIVLYNPLASELRSLFAMYRIVQNLERIADRVIKMVSLKQKIMDVELYTKIIPKLNGLVKQTVSMVQKAVFSFQKNDKNIAVSIMKEELNFHNLNSNLLNTAVKELELQVDVETLLLSITDIRSIISSLDRIGDHAHNIAEATIYSIVGKNFTHQEIDNNQL